MFKSLISNSRRRQFFNLLGFYAAYLWFRSFSSSVLSPHFANEGLTIEQMILGTLYTFVGAGLLMILTNKISARLSWGLSFIASFLSILLIMRIANPAQFYLASVISGLYIPLFYIAYNIAHYRLTPAHRTGYSSAIMFSIFPIVGLVAPLAAGWLAEINYLYVWIFSGIFFLITFLLTKFQTNFLIKYDLVAGWRAIKSTRIIVFLQGIWEALPFGIIPVFSLHFIKSPLYYGTFIAYLSLMSVIANLVLGYLSDKFKRRLAFLYPIALTMAVATFVFPLVTANLIFWLILTGVIQFLCPLFWNFSASWFVDQQPDHDRSMPIRELVLAIGRIVGLFFAWISFRFETIPVYIFYFLGVIMLLYPVVLLYNTRHAAKF